MKKKRIFLITAVMVFAVLCISFVLNLTKEAYTLDWLTEKSDYAVIAQRNTLKCEDTGKAYVMNAYEGREPYKKDGKVYTEMYICCPCENFLGEKITVVTDGYYFKEDDFCFLFLNCIDDKNGLYTPVNDKTGIIKGKNGKLRPMDRALKEDVKNNFSEIGEFYDWFTDIGKQKTESIKESNTEPEPVITTAPETTAAPISVS